MAPPIVQGAGAKELAAFEKLWTDFMVASQVPAVALAVARNGKLLLAKSYTLDEKEPVALQLSPFRFASCSKLITTIAIHQLFEKVSGFTLASKASDILKNLPAPKKKILGNVLIADLGKAIKSTRWANVTVQDLLMMKSGLRAGFADLDFDVCKAYFHPLPANNKKEIIRYALTFDDEPGASYRNFDFFILTAIIEELTGMDYVLAVRKNILEPLGLVRPQAAGSLAKDRVPYELSYHPIDTALRPNVMSTDPILVPNGEGNVNLEVGVGVGGWLMAAADYAKILSIFDSGFEGRLFENHSTVTQMFSIPDPGPPVLGLGWSIGKYPKTTSFEWGGVLPGVRPYTARREDGVSIVTFYNTDTVAADTGWFPTLLGKMHVALDDISSWPASSFDLFESVGIPAASSNRRWNSKPAVAEKGSGWHGWFDLGGRLAGAPSATMVHPGFYDIYAHGTGGRLWQKWWDGKKWNPSETGWTLHDDKDFRLASGPAATSLGDSFRDVYAQGKDGAVYHKSWNGKEWRRWFRLGGQIEGPPGVAVIRVGLRDIYVRGTNDHLWQKWWDGEKWNPSDDGWNEHKDGDFRLGSGPAVISDGDNFRDVYVRGEDGAVYHKFWNGKKWTEWFGLGGQIIGQPAVVFFPPNFIDIYVRGTDNRLWQKWWDGEKWNPSATDWVPHDDSGFQLTSSPSVISDGPHHRGVFVRGPENVLYYKFWLA